MFTFISKAKCFQYSFCNAVVFPATCMHGLPPYAVIADRLQILLVDVCRLYMLSVICCWQLSPIADLARYHLYRFVMYRSWPVQKQFTRDRTIWVEIRLSNNARYSSADDHRSWQPIFPLCSYVDTCNVWHDIALTIGVLSVQVWVQVWTCETHGQHIYESAIVLNSSVGCWRPICLVYGTTVPYEVLLKSAIQKSSFLLAYCPCWTSKCRLIVGLVKDIVMCRQTGWASILCNMVSTDELLWLVFKSVHVQFCVCFSVQH